MFCALVTVRDKHFACIYADVQEDRGRCYISHRDAYHAIDSCLFFGTLLKTDRLLHSSLGVGRDKLLSLTIKVRAKLESWQNGM